MIDALILIVLLTVVVGAIRGGKSVTLNPVIIQRPGQYHITLAPQLVGAQTFIEQIAMQFSKLPAQQSEFATQYFAVQAPLLSSRGVDCYLLAVALRGGVLYAQAITQPLLRDADSQIKMIKEFSEAVLAQHPYLGATNQRDVKNLVAAIEMVAKESQIKVKVMQATD